MVKRTISFAQWKMECNNLIKKCICSITHALFWLPKSKNKTFQYCSLDGSLFNSCRSFSQLSETALLHWRGCRGGAGIVSFLQLAGLSAGLQLCYDWPSTLGYFMHWNMPAELVMNLSHLRIAGLVHFSSLRWNSVVLQVKVVCTQF